MQTKIPAERVAAEVRAEMARHRTAQVVLAEWLGISQAAVSRRLTGEIPFDVAELETIASHFGVPVAQFIAPLDDAGSAA